jgi:hypothetical protein
VLRLPIETSLVNRVRGQGYFLLHPGHSHSFSLENIQAPRAQAGFEVMRFYFEPRILGTRWWMVLMQTLSQFGNVLLGPCLLGGARKVCEV